ncbi:hypothetical protein [Chitinophaga sp. S165]|uniref:hypothetical protein n=1 Tax=Chitinophaga sp. S165 TaxID=2135462 RepID=UPI000D71B9C9|nr:hypothetical protein [Chitinophaga sp. S165]PWV45007.1 hypothetical protein C7475_11649 [Chitinophaga sp. S165]
MAETQNAAPRPPYRDNDGNEITAIGKFYAGVIIIFFTFFSAFYLVGHWPDRIPGPKDDIAPLYTFRWFHVRLVDSTPDTSTVKQETAVTAESDAADSTQIKSDSTVDSTTPVPLPKDAAVSGQKISVTRMDILSEDKLMHINTLLLILVAVAGFLGNMIHISASFTSYIGAGKFRKSWILWYCVKPFTAAALALAVYFVFRGGFLNMSDDGANINIYGVMTISILSGLFTDRATLKLKEVFEVLFRPKEERPDQLKNGGLKITGVDAAPLEAGQSTVITLKGEKMDEGKIDISIGDDIIQDIDRKPDSISFTYTLPEALKDKDAVTLSVKPENAATPDSYQLKVNAKPVQNNTVIPEDEGAGHA